jgi:hypothetical protein
LKSSLEFTFESHEPVKTANHLKSFLGLRKLWVQRSPLI